MGGLALSASIPLPGLSLTGALVLIFFYVCVSDYDAEVCYIIRICVVLGHSLEL